MFDDWGFLLVPALAGLVLPPFIGARVLILAAIGLGLIEVYEREFYDPGITHTFGLMILAALVVMFGLGLLVRAVIHGLRPKAAPPAPGWMRWIDRFLVIAAAAIPAGMMALILGSVLAGAQNPRALHLALLAGLALACGASLRWLTGMPRLATLAFCGFLGGIIVHSMQMEAALRDALAQTWPGLAKCLSIGPDGLGPDQVPPLMGLTAPKPILLLVAAEDRPRVMRWSFRGGVFAEGGAPPREVACSPALP